MPGNISTFPCDDLFRHKLLHTDLTEEEIDEAAFKCLKYDMIKEIIPRIGKRAKFVQRYEEYKENLTERPAFAELQLDDKNLLRKILVPTERCSYLLMYNQFALRSKCLIDQAMVVLK
uniref:Uncharacterized protein n=1 Tax=Anopheles culicifacies TaxID=139723 RepID=A0A182M053_9DIPT